MPFLLADRVLETSTSTGTGAFTLAGAVSGFRTFASQFTVADTTWYLIEAVDANGIPTGEWETGLGTYSAASTLTRTTVVASSNANAAVSFAAGTKRVAVTLPSNGFLTAPVAHLTAEANEPTPVANKVLLYAKTLAPNFTTLKMLRPSGVDTPLQDGLAFNRFIQYRGSAAAVTAQGAGALTASTAVTAVTPTSGTSARNQVQRVQQATAATANAIVALYANAAGLCPVLRGGIAGEGGFRMLTRFGISASTTGQRFYAGLVDVVTVPTNVDPFTATAPGAIGLAANLATSANWSIVHNVTGTAKTRIDLGANFPVNATDLIELFLFCQPNVGGTAQPVSYRVRRYTTNPSAPAFEASGTLSTNLPAGATLLHPSIWQVNVAAAAASWQFNQLTIESDW